MNRTRRNLSIFLSLALIFGPAATTWANGGGRIGNPKNLRTRKTQKERGRIMRRPPIPEPRMKTPATYRATIPDPTPRHRGGGGYARRGKYFYEKPKPIYASRGRTKRLMPPDPTYRKTRR